MKFTVTYGYRTDDGMNYSMPTHYGTVEVEAEDAQNARREAIDAAHAKHSPNCSHVVIVRCSPAIE